MIVTGFVNRICYRIVTGLLHGCFRGFSELVAGLLQDCNNCYRISYRLVPEPTHSNLDKIEKYYLELKVKSNTHGSRNEPKLTNKTHPK